MNMTQPNASRDNPEEMLLKADNPFFDPYRDEGITFVRESDWIFKEIQPAKTLVHAASAFPEQQKVLEKETKRLNTYRPRHALIYNQSSIFVDTAKLSDKKKW